MHEDGHLLDKGLNVTFYPGKSMLQGLLDTVHLMPQHLTEACMKTALACTLKHLGGSLFQGLHDHLHSVFDLPALAVTVSTS